MDEATSKIERIRASRGNYEIEVTSTGEAGLHQCANLCPKNPGHCTFFDRHVFSTVNLGPRYPDQLLVDWTRAMSDLTCRLLVSRISNERPETWPDSENAFPFSLYKGENFTTVGTGWVCEVPMFNNNGPCPCHECHQSSTDTPTKTWNYVYIQTALHVVFNTEEARHTKCQFFYDSPETDVNTVPTITGLKVVYSDIKGDWCRMECVTHDMKLVNKLSRMFCFWNDLRYRVQNKYMSKTPPGLPMNPVPTWDLEYIFAKKSFMFDSYGWSTFYPDPPGLLYDHNGDPDLCIIVSHPHGGSKKISVGSWKGRRVLGKTALSEYISYSYNTPTCPGSSGAAVITLYKDRKHWGYNIPSHSEGGPLNINYSGVGIEYFVSCF